MRPDVTLSTASTTGTTTSAPTRIASRARRFIGGTLYGAAAPGLKAL
jgi:hypothetical protein